MNDFSSLVADDKKLGVGEILICNKETKGKFEPLKHFIGKVILAIGGGGDKIFIVEEKDKYKSEVKSIQINPNLVQKKYKLNQTNTYNNSKNDSYLAQNIELEEEEEKKLEDDFEMKNEEKKEPEEENNNNNNNQDLDDSTEREIPAHIVQICKGKYHLIKLT
jgi:hypothetical protein